MKGLEGAVLIPILILGSAAILYLGLIGMRARQSRGRAKDGPSGS